MRRILIAPLLLLAAVMLTGMGGLGGTPEGAVPKTDENIKAQVTDRSGVVTELNQFSMGGNVFIEGGRGEGTMSVKFHDLKEITFGAVGAKEVQADLLLKSGSRVQLKVNKSAVFNGDPGSGAFRIPAGNISKIVFH